MSTPPIDVLSTDAKVAAVKASNAGGGGFGVWGSCDTGHGVHGDSLSSRGVVGTSQNFHGVFGKSTNNVGVAGESNNMTGVLGVCVGPAGPGGGAGAGVKGENRNEGGFGVWGTCETGHGVHGDSTTSRGVVGTSRDFHGVYGQSNSNVGVVGESNTMAGVLGVCEHGDGVVGRGHRGVVGESDGFQGVYGHSRANAGVVGDSSEFDGVWGMSHSATAAGVSGHNDAGGLAGFFEGTVRVTGDIECPNCDCAEDFDIEGAGRVEPGTVMVLGAEGVLAASGRAYDRRVAGVISGAGDFRPGLVLGRRREAGGIRQPVALMGRVFCKVDAAFGAVEVGDLLTSSPTPGHAMKAIDPARAFGAVIGKALRPLPAGQALIPILIALQ